MAKDFAVIFDNGGGTLLQVGKRGFVHHYDRGEDAARDVKVLIEDNNAKGWEGDESEMRIEYDGDEERNGSYRWHDRKDVLAVIKSGKLSSGDNGHGWRNAENFYAALGVEVED